MAKFKGVISVISGADDGTEKDYVWAIYPSSAAVGYSEPNGNSATAVLTADFPVIQASKAGSYADDIAMTIGRSESLGVYFKSVYSCLRQKRHCLNHAEGKEQRDPRRQDQRHTGQQRAGGDTGHGLRGEGGHHECPGWRRFRPRSGVLHGLPSADILAGNLPHTEKD